jgi:hypothetical protein
MFKRVTAAPKQSTTNPTHVRKVYLLVVSTLTPVVRIASARFRTREWYVLDGTGG